MQKILIVIFLVLLGTLGWFYSKPKEEVLTVHTDEEIQMTPLIKEKKEKTIPIIDKKPSKETGTKESPTSTEMQKENPSQTLLYESLTLEEAKLSTPPRKKVAPIGAIQIKQHMSEVQPNDTLTLSDVEGLDYTLTVQSVQTNNDGSTSTTANYKDEGITYTTTITQSDKSTYITLSTANGLYEIETSADTGYIYKTIDIRKQLQSRTPNDVIILPIPNSTLNK